MKSFGIIVAVDLDDGIGYKGNIMWENLPEDRKFIKRITTECPDGTVNALIMGKNTFLSINKPLKSRLCIVISTTIKSSSINEIINNIEKEKV